MVAMIFAVLLFLAVAGVGVAIAMGKNNALVGARDTTVAMGSRGTRRTGERLVAAAPRQGWQVLVGAAVDRSMAPDLAMRAAPAVRCEHVVSGDQPRRFVAETWLVDQRKPGALVGSEMRQHLMIVPLRTPMARFAVGRDGVDRGAAAWSVPDDLTAAPRRSLDGLTVLGDDRGLAQWLRPWLPRLADARIWVVVAGDRLVLSRQGAIGPDEVMSRLGLAAELADALERAASGVG